MICPKCGIAQPETNNFCPACGTRNSNGKNAASTADDKAAGSPRNAAEWYKKGWQKYNEMFLVLRKMLSRCAERRAVDLYKSLSSDRPL